MGYDGKIIFDEKYPDGTPRKLLDSTIINSLGWKPHIDLESGLKDDLQILFKRNVNQLNA